jgi:hypothetical protein
MNMILVELLSVYMRFSCIFLTLINAICVCAVSVNWQVCMVKGNSKAM